MKKIFIIALLIFSNYSFAKEQVGCVDTNFHLTFDDKVCVDAFHDPDIQGVVCHVSYAKKGGISGELGFAENPSRFSIACRQNGPIVFKKHIPTKENNIFQERASFLFKSFSATRFWDQKNNTIVYLMISKKIINGSPMNSISTIPLQSWNNIQPKIQ